MSRLAELLATFDPALPLARARTLPGTVYTAPEIAAAEQRAVFASSWQCVGRVDQVAEPGRYLTFEVAGEPIVVVRGEDGVLRAFSNVCRHRAARVMPEPCGHATRLRCRYHGWTYDLAGRLRGIPEWDGVEEFRREDHGLPPVAVDTWGPLVFVHLGEAPPPLAGLLAAIAPPSGVVFHARREYELGCNWKIFVDNYLDGGYHVNTLHPSLAGALDYAGYHTVVHDWTSTQVSPLRTPERQLDAEVASVRRGDAAYYHWIWPNLMINVYQGVMDTNAVFPLGVDRCRVLFDFYFAEGTPPDVMERSVAVAHQVQLEDEAICGEVQRGLGSRTYTAGRFSVRRENGGLHFHRLLHAALAGLGQTSSTRLQ
jgi:choline monooxygenase